MEQIINGIFIYLSIYLFICLFIYVCIYLYDIPISEKQMNHRIGLGVFPYIGPNAFGSWNNIICVWLINIWIKWKRRGNSAWSNLVFSLSWRGKPMVVSPQAFRRKFSLGKLWEFSTLNPLPFSWGYHVWPCLTYVMSRSTLTTQLIGSPAFWIRFHLANRPSSRSRHPGPLGANPPQTKLLQAPLEFDDLTWQLHVCWGFNHI